MSGYEHFVTPEWIVEAALNLVPQSPAPRTILDAGAGTGVWGQVARRRWMNAPYIFGVEIDDRFTHPGGYDVWLEHDFLSFPDISLPDGEADLVMSNPPFSLAEEFVYRALKLAHPDGGRVVMLLRQAFLNGIDRGNGLWKSTPLEHVSMLCRRPSFTGNGRTDTKTEYAIFVWRNGYTGQPTLSWVRGEKVQRKQKVTA